MSDERREYERFPLQVKVTLDLGDSEKTSLQTRDLSVGGVLLDCPTALARAIKKGQRVYMSITSEDGLEAETMPADVVRTTENGIALRFDRVAMESAA